MNDPRTVSAREAARQLDITKATLYAYVSRGLIRSEPGEGKSRARRYLREDIEALLARKAMRQNPAKVAETALDWGQPVLVSQITLIENGRFYYRGHDALLLTDRPFEAVCHLLWQDRLEAMAFGQTAVPESWIPLLHQLQPALAGHSFLDQLMTVLPLAAGHDLAAWDSSPTAVSAIGDRLYQLATELLVGTPVQESLAQTLFVTWCPDQPDGLALINAALVLCADHELNVSAFTARTVASAGNPPYTAVLAALAALRGTKHGGHTERIGALLAEIAHSPSPEPVRAVVMGRLQRGESLPGFGHPLYPDGDPRAAFLINRLQALFGETAETAVFTQLIDLAETAVGKKPTVDMGLVMLAHCLRLPPGAPLTLFALGRMAGWIAHIIEQNGQDQLIRPRAKYLGPRPAPSSV